MRDIVFVAGMHRSGTSALARVLALCGGTLPFRIIGPDAGNPSGYWEPRGAVRLNDRFFANHGSSWRDERFELPVGPEAAERFIDELTAFLTLGFPGGGPLVMKDPRASVVLGSWLRAAERSGLRATVVHSYRHYDDVAASLARRHAMTQRSSDALWLKYNLLAEHDARAVPRVFVRYDDVVDDWRAVVAACARRLELPLDASPSAVSAIDAFLREDLRHAPPATGDRLEREPPASLLRLLDDARASAPDPSAFDALFDEVRRSAAA